MLNRIFKSRKSKASLLRVLDVFFLKNRKKILFVVKNKTNFSGNLRVALESYTKNDRNRIYLYKDGKCPEIIKKELRALNVVVLEGFNIYSIWHILTSATVILSHNPRDAHLSRKIKSRKIINLWHGVAIKKIELLIDDTNIEKLKLLKNNSRLYDMIIASSDLDKKTNAKAFGVDLDIVKVTGLPRYEILKRSYTLGTTLEDERRRILDIKSDKKLIIYAPTFREINKSAIYNINSTEWKEIELFAKNNNIIFGIRPHPYDIQYLPDIIKKKNNIALFDNTTFIETNLLLKYTDMLIVDYSSIWIDYLLLRRPIIGFAKDFEFYSKKERGFIYKFEEIFPSKFTCNINDLISELQKNIDNPMKLNYQHAINLFHKYDLDYDFKSRIYKEIESIRSTP